MATRQTKTVVVLALHLDERAAPTPSARLMQTAKVRSLATMGNAVSTARPKKALDLRVRTMSAMMNGTCVFNGLHGPFLVFSFDFFDFFLLASSPSSNINSYFLHTFLTSNPWCYGHVDTTLSPSPVLLHYYDNCRQIYPHRKQSLKEWILLVRHMHSNSIYSHTFCTCRRHCWWWHSTSSL